MRILSQQFGNNFLGLHLLGSAVSLHAMETLTINSDGDTIPINHITVKSTFESNNPQRGETAEVDSILNEIDQLITDSPYTKPACEIGSNLNGKLRSKVCDVAATTDSPKQGTGMNVDVKEKSLVHKDEEAVIPTLESLNDPQKIYEPSNDGLPSPGHSKMISPAAPSTPSPGAGEALPSSTSEPKVSSPAHGCSGTLPLSDNHIDMQQVTASVSTDNSINTDGEMLTPTMDAKASPPSQDISKSPVGTSPVLAPEADPDCGNHQTQSEKAPSPLLHSESDSMPGSSEASTDSKFQTLEEGGSVPSTTQSDFVISDLESTPPDIPQSTRTAAEGVETTLSMQSKSKNNAGIEDIQSSSNSPSETATDSENIISEGQGEAVAGQSSSPEINSDSKLSMPDATQKDSKSFANNQKEHLESSDSSSIQTTGDKNSGSIKDGCETEKSDTFYCFPDSKGKVDSDPQGEQKITESDSFTEEMSSNAEGDKVEEASADCVDPSNADIAEMEVDFNSSDNDVCGIQILESTSMAGNGDLFSMEESEAGANKGNEAHQVAEKNSDVCSISSKESQQKEDTLNGKTLNNNSGFSGDDEEIEKLEKADLKNKTIKFVRGDNKEVSVLQYVSDNKESKSIPSSDIKDNNDSIILIEEETDSGAKDSHEELLPPNDSVSLTNNANLTSKGKSDMETDDVVKKINQLVSNNDNHKVDTSSDVNNKSKDGEVSQSGCKRLLSPEPSKTAPKRPKLDKTESALEEGKGGIEPLFIDSDDDVIVEEDAAVVHDKNKGTTKEIKTDDASINQKSDSEKTCETNSTTDDKSSISAITSEVKPAELTETKDDKTDLKDVKAPSKIHISAQVLEAYITSRIKAFIKRQQQQQLEKLNKRITTMQSSTNLWEETAKHLEKSVKEVSILCKNLDKRRAHANACKKFSSRTVGVQVNDNKVKGMLSATQSQSNPANRGPNTGMYNPALGPSLLLTPSQQAAQSPQQLAQLRQRTPPQAQPPLRGNQGAPQTTSPRRALPPVMASSSNDVNMIDLTDDDDVGKRDAKPPGPLSSKRPTVPSGKTAPATMNGFIPLAPNPATALAQGGIRQQAPLISQQLALGRGAVRLSHPQGQTAALVGGLAGPRTPTLAAVSQAQNSKAITMHTLPPSLFIQQSRHPAPLPQSVETNPPNVRPLKLPPKPSLKISRVSNGIVLSWNMPSLAGVEAITFYQLFAYQETDSPPKTSLWKKVGDVRALPLPMACTLTEFQEGNKYHFAVRAVDKYSRTGTFSDPSSIFLGSSKASNLH